MTIHNSTYSMMLYNMGIGYIMYSYLFMQIYVLSNFGTYKILTSFLIKINYILSKYYLICAVYNVYVHRFQSLFRLQCVY